MDMFSLIQLAASSRGVSRDRGTHSHIAAFVQQWGGIALSVAVRRLMCVVRCFDTLVKHADFMIHTQFEFNVAELE